MKKKKLDPGLTSFKEEKRAYIFEVDLEGDQERHQVEVLAHDLRQAFQQILFELPVNDLISLEVISVQ